MIISNNLMALAAESQLTKNTKKASGFAKKLSSGERVNSAQDDASTYAISEKMKSSIRALSQCGDNVKNASNLLSTASGAVDQQVNIMKKVRELTMKASDDVYTSQDREVLQREVSQMLDQSEDLAHATNFNGQPLLNRAEFDHQDRWFDDSVPYHVNPNGEPVLKFPSYTVPGTGYNSSLSGQSPPIGNYVPITPTNIYDGSTVLAGADLTALPSVNDVVWDKTKNTYARVYRDSLDLALHMGDPSGANTLIGISGLANPPLGTAPSTNVAQAVYGTAGSYPPAVGSSVVVSPVPSFDGANPPGVLSPPTYPVRNAPGSGILSYFKPGGSDSEMDIDFSDLFAPSPSALATLPTDLDGIGFSMACGGCDQFVTIQFDASTDDSTLYTGTNKNPNPLCFVIGVQNVTDKPSLMQALYNGILKANGSTPLSSWPSSSDIAETITPIHSISLNYYASTDSFTIKKSGPDMIFNNGIMGEMIQHDYFKPQTSLAVQSGESSSQYTKVLVPNTTLSVLFPDAKKSWAITPKDSDYPTEWPNGYEKLSDAEKKAKWRNEAWPYPDQNVDLQPANCVRTRQTASQFLDHVDQALKYLISSNTTLGAQISRMEYTGENLDTTILNQTSSVSTMRDTNMAEAMLGYTKENILTQTAQAMLAQANQSPSKVLSLLQG